MVIYLAGLQNVPTQPRGSSYRWCRDPAPLLERYGAYDYTGNILQPSDGASSVPYRYSFMS